MKTRMLYQCEKCGAEYENEENALKCEKNHMRPEYTDSFYRLGQSKPFKLNVGFSDDTVGIYELKRIEKIEEDEVG